MPFLNKNKYCHLSGMNFFMITNSVAAWSGSGFTISKGGIEDPDPDPLFRKDGSEDPDQLFPSVDPRIRIRNAAKNSSNKHQ